MIVLDLFCGTKSIAKAFGTRGHTVYTVDWDKQFNPTMVANIGKMTVNDIIKLCGGVPDVIWASPDCTTYSVLCRRYFGRHFGQAVFEGDIEAIKKRWEENPYFESDEVNIRQMTVKECERLQTLPDDYTETDGVSTKMRYETLGNGWTVDVIAHIFAHLPTRGETDGITD